MINIWLLLAVILWGMSFIWTKMALEYLTPSEIITVRLVLGLAALLGVQAFKKIEFHFERTDLGLIAAASVVFGIHLILQAVGMVYTSATNTAWLVATIPVFIAVASRFILKEDLNRWKIFGIAIATMGVLLLISKGNLSNFGWLKSIGDWIILSSSITWTIYTILTRNITNRHNPLTIIISLLIIPTVILSIYTLSFTPFSKFSELPVNIILILLILGILCAGLLQWIWLEGLAKKGAVGTGVYIYIEPIVTTLAAMPILDESLTVISGIGAVMILGGVYLVERQKNRNRNGGNGGV